MLFAIHFRGKIPITEGKELSPIIEKNGEHKNKKKQMKDERNWRENKVKLKMYTAQRYGRGCTGL